MLEWARSLESAQRVVGKDTVGRFWVSTVFLGLDHDYATMAMIREFGGGLPLEFYRPLLFETMVFDNKVSEMTIPGGQKMKYHESQNYMARTRSWDEAVAQHARAVKIMKRYDRMLTHQEQVLAKLEGSL